MRQLIPPYDGAPDLFALYGQDAYVRAGFVTSLDGATVVNGDSKALSGPADRVVFRTLRAACDVILVGAGTTRAEDYGTIRLTDEGALWRAEHGRPTLPRVAVVSQSLDIDQRVFDGSGPIVVTCASADVDRLEGRADVVIAGEEVIDIAAALDALVDRGLPRILCEGGPTLLASIIEAGRLDELCLTTSPLLVGPTEGLIPEGLRDPVRLELHHLLEQDGALLARYTVVDVGRGTVSPLRQEHP